jgi:hypothetical protein
MPPRLDEENALQTVVFPVETGNGPIEHFQAKGIPVRVKKMR